MKFSHWIFWPQINHNITLTPPAQPYCILRMIMAKLLTRATWREWFCWTTVRTLSHWIRRSYVVGFSVDAVVLIEIIYWIEPKKCYRWNWVFTCVQRRLTRFHTWSFTFQFIYYMFIHHDNEDPKSTFHSNFDMLSLNTNRELQAHICSS